MHHNRHIAYFDQVVPMIRRGAYGTKSAQKSPQSFGERLRRTRLAWGWSQGRLAEALGSNQRLVSHWERDIAKPSSAALTAIASLLGMSTETLLTGDGFSIPNMPALLEGEERETVAQYIALSRLLPKPSKGGIMLVDLNAFESKSLTLGEALRTMKDANSTDPDIWLVVRSHVEPKTT